MLGPFIRVVGDEEVAGTDLVFEIAETAGEGGRHAAEMNRVAHALAHEIAVGGEHGVEKSQPSRTTAERAV